MFTLIPTLEWLCPFCPSPLGSHTHKHTILNNYHTLQLSHHLPQEPTLYIIKGIAILDNDGNRLLAKYYDPSVFPGVKEERKFEKDLFQKTHRANAEVIMLDRLTCVYRSNVDLFFYVMGMSHENEVGASLCVCKRNYCV